MKYINQLIFISTVILSLTSCTALKDRLAIYNAPNQGYLVLSQSATKDTIYGLYTLKVRYKDDEEFTINYLQNNMFKPDNRDFNDNNSNGKVSIFNLPPGKYKIFSYVVAQQGNGLSWFPKDEISIPFEIKTNEITYLGEYLAIKQTGKNLFGHTIPWGAIIKVENQFERDMSIAKKRNKKFEQLKINKQVPKIKSL